MLTGKGIRNHPSVMIVLVATITTWAVLLSGCGLDSSSKGKRTIASEIAESELKLADVRAEGQKPKPVLTPPPDMTPKPNLIPALASHLSPSMVRKIDLPFHDPIFPAGRGRKQFMVSCTICHSLRYVTMQPDFPRKTWEKTVDKMIKTYGAHITQNEAQEIVDYLVSIKSPPDEGVK